MPDGTGKYDAYATLVREGTDAKCVVVIVLDGYKGSGFAVQSVAEAMPAAVLAQLLRNVARTIETSPPEETTS